MPTERFFHLPTEKKQRIVNAAIAELSRTPFDSISINKIVQAADIPRGSFYQYFEDKLDLLGFLLQDFKNEMLQLFLQTLDATNGDIFAACLAALDVTISYGTKAENIAMAQNIFPHLKLEDGRCVFPVLLTHLPANAAPCQKEDYESIQQLVGYLLSFPQNVMPEQELRNLLEILVALFRYTVAQTFFHLEQKEEIRENFQSKLSILKRCMQKEVPHHVEI